MPLRSAFKAIVVMASCSISVVACAWPFSDSIKDIRVVAAIHVDLKDQSQIEWVDSSPRPSRILTRIDFTTATDLLAFARKHEYNVNYAVGPCSKGGVTDAVDHYSGVYWGSTQITPYAKDIPGYATSVSKGGLMVYQAYVLIPSNYAGKQMCLALAGGNMAGGKLRSNVAVIPNTPTAPVSPTP